MSLNADTCFFFWIFHLSSVGRRLYNVIILNRTTVRDKRKEVPMRYKDPELKRKMHSFIKKYYVAEDRMPSVSELAEEFHIAKSTAHAYLVEMGEDHIITYRDGRIELDKKDKVRNKKELTSLVGYACCGEPAYEEEDIEFTVALPTEVFGTGPLYMLHAYGDSMEDEGIEDGDLLVIHKNDRPEVGKIIVALDPDQGNTVKKYMGIDKETGKAVLAYCNQAVYGDKVILVDTLVCQGVLSHVIKGK